MQRPLPAGMPDYLFDQASEKNEILQGLLRYFIGNSYDYVEPPLCEFEHDINNKLTATLKEQTFTFPDSTSHQNIALRSDMTAQIARIVEDRLKNVKRPIRLCYGGEVVRKKSSQYRYLRQFTQVGIELISDDHIHHDCEVMILAICALKHIGIHHITIDLAFPSYAQNLINNIPDYDREEVLSAFVKRDQEKLLQYSYKECALLCNILHVCGPFSQSMQKARKVQCKEITPIIAYLEEIYAILNMHDHVRVYCDLADLQGYDYKEGVAFSVYSHEQAQKTPAPLGRGGRYRFGNDKETAIGFTLYCDTLLNIQSYNKSMDASVLVKEIDIHTCFEEREQYIKEGFKLKHKNGVV